MNILTLRRWLYLFSLLTLIGGVAAMIRFGLPLGIDFTGGSILELQLTDTTALIQTDDLEREQQRVTNVVYTTGIAVKSSQFTSDQHLLVKTAPIEPAKLETLKAALPTHQLVLLKTETVGPTVSQSLTKRAIINLIVASAALIAFIAYAFRRIPQPLSAWRFGITTIIAMVHDVGVVLGIFALLAASQGPTFELNSEFIAAILTVVGFSVHDTIVVFDRIRENLLTNKLQNGGQRVGEWFEAIASKSLSETIVRSLNTSLTTLFALLVVILFGGSAVLPFSAALFIGIFTGTYSSIFVATPLLVDWQYWVEKRRKRD